jgi:hypothetical protein
MAMERRQAAKAKALSLFDAQMQGAFSDGHAQWYARFAVGQVAGEFAPDAYLAKTIKTHVLPLRQAVLLARLERIVRDARHSP